MGTGLGEPPAGKEHRTADWYQEHLCFEPAEQFTVASLGARVLMVLFHDNEGNDLEIVSYSVSA